MALLNEIQAKYDLYIKKVFLYMPTYHQFNIRNIENDVFCSYVGHKKMLKFVPKVEYVAYPNILKSFIRFSSCETKNNKISLEKKSKY